MINDARLPVAVLLGVLMANGACRPCQGMEGYLELEHHVLEVASAPRSDLVGARVEVFPESRELVIEYDTEGGDAIRLVYLLD